MAFIVPTNTKVLPARFQHQVVFKEEHFVKVWSVDLCELRKLFVLGSTQAVNTLSTCEHIFRCDDVADVSNGSYLFYNLSLFQLEFHQRRIRIIYPSELHEIVHALSVDSSISQQHNRMGRPHAKIFYFQILEERHFRSAFKNMRAPETEVDRSTHTIERFIA